MQFEAVYRYSLKLLELQRIRLELVLLELLQSITLATWVWVMLYSTAFAGSTGIAFSLSNFFNC
jgi:hypothetical protein